MTRAIAMALAVCSAGAAAQRPASVAPPAMQKVATALADYTDAVLFGDVWRRPGLAPRDRSLVTVSVLIATGKTAQLRGHLGRALDNGVKPEEIAGLVTHLAFYTGWPSAVSSTEVIEQVFAERRIAVSAPATRTTPASPVSPVAGGGAPGFAELTARVVDADLWRRTDLVPRDRSLVTIAAIAAAGGHDELVAHVRRGVSNGLTRGEIGEALTHLAFYAGWPRASAAVRAADQVFSEPASAPLNVVAPGVQPVAGPASNFTGEVTVASAFRGSGGARLGGATVTFRPGARSNWHSHPLGQLLIVTAGRGWVQAEGGAVRAIGPGDVVWTAPGVRHWHGATRTSAMTHVAVAEAVDGRSVTWMEPVGETTYAGPR